MTDISKNTELQQSCITAVIKSLSSEFVDWEKVKSDYYKYRNSFEGESVTTASSVFYFLENNELSPFTKPNNVL